MKAASDPGPAGPGARGQHVGELMASQGLGHWRQEHMSSEGTVASTPRASLHLSWVMSRGVTQLDTS